MTQLGVLARPSWVNAQRCSRWIWDLRRPAGTPAGSSLNALDPLVLTMVRGGGLRAAITAVARASLPTSARPGEGRDGV